MKNFKFIFITVFAFILCILKVDAASVSIKSNYTSITKGGYATVIATVSSESPIVSIEGTLNCTGNNAISMNYDDSSNSLYSKSYSTTVKGNSVGTISCNVSGVRITSMSSSDWQYLGNKTVNIKVTEPVYTPPKVYSKNNNLSSLSIEGYQISPAFNKNTLEYSVELPNEVTKIKIVTKKEDSTAKVTGDGEFEVIEGLNKIEIKVTAENGSVKTYVINATVKELDPIIIKIDNQEYNVVRKKEQLKSPNSNFIETTIKINDSEVPAFENKKINYILVGLKDAQGDISLYIYNEKNNTYTPYQEYNFKSSIICILDDASQIPKGYTKTKIKMNGKSTAVYKSSNSSKFYLFYGINVETGKKSLYVYDSIEETIQRYNNNKTMNEANEKEELYQYIIIGLGSLLIITYLVLLISLINNSKKKKRNKEKKLSKKEDIRKKSKDTEEDI